MASRKKELEGFWLRVDRGKPTECWSWKSYVSQSGYGQLVFRGTTMSASRASYMLMIGDVPKGMVVRHRCDNRLCVNPAHLELGTQLENVQDRVVRGRNANLKGEKNGNSRLTEGDVLQIIRRRRCGETLQRIADAFGVTNSYVNKIVTGARWPHLKGAI